LKKLLLSVTAAICFALPAEAQYFPPTVAPGTVLGRMPGVGSGPVEQIPFATFAGLTTPYLPLTGGTLTGPLTIDSTLTVQVNPVLAVGLNPISFFGATKSVNTAGVALEGMILQVTDTAGWSGIGQNNFIEAIRTGAILSNSSTLGSAYGGIFVANDQNATSHLNLFGIEGATFNYTETAPAPSALNCSSSCTLSGAWLGGTGGTKAIDAIFMVNPYPGTSAAQSGFLSAGNGLIDGGFVDISTTAKFGVDLAYGVHSQAAIHIANNESIAWDTAAHASTLPALYLDTSAVFHVGQGAAGVVLAAPLAPVTISGLGACASGNAGQVAYVKDTVASGAATFHGAITGGGATTVAGLATCNGSNWQWG
jgi:hypothetical protein